LAVSPPFFWLGIRANSAYKHNLHFAAEPILAPGRAIAIDLVLHLWIWPRPRGAFATVFLVQLRPQSDHFS
jgi:hypothetical protein